MHLNKLLIFFCLALVINTGCKEKSDISPGDSKLSADELNFYARKTFSQRSKVNSPEEELAGFKVPEGFIVELVASERDGVINPIDLTFDDVGRLWTQTAEMYPLDPVADIHWQELLKLMSDPEAQEQNPAFKRIFDLYRGKTKGKDKILILSNLYNDAAVTTSIWADGLTLPQSILPYKNGSYVVQGSELFFLSDTNNDGKADKRTPLFTGFGITDTHTMAHTLVRGPGDWVHFSHGALNKGEVTSLVNSAKVRMDYSKIAKFSLDAKKIELVNSGLNNIWGFQLRGNGQWYGSEANDLGYSVVPMEAGTGFPGIGSDRIRPYQPWMPKLHDFHVGGTGISGLAFDDDSEGSFPEVWKNVALLANPITSTINAVRIIRNPDGSISAEHLPDLLSSEDDWFRPVNMEFGPDGCLYIADWYNKIISHNELPTTHPDRDKSHGRIWRIRHRSQKPRKIQNFYEVKTKDLVGFLKSPSIWAKRAAWHQISDRPIEETKKLADELVVLAANTSEDEVTRILALWSLEGIHHYDEVLMRVILESPDHNLRREAVRSLVSFSLKADQIANLLEELSEDSNPMVRAQVLRTLSQLGIANKEIIGLLVKACRPALEGNEMGGSYERNFERYLARKALENYPIALLNLMTSSEARHYAIPNLIWASQALPKQERERIFIDLWKKSGYKELDQSTFIIVANMLSNTSIFKAVKPILEQTDKAEFHVSLALENLEGIQSDELTQLLVKPIKSLLKNKEERLQHLGLEAVGKLKIDHLRESVIFLIQKTSTHKTLNLVLRALENRPKENKDIFALLAKDKTLTNDLRTSALHLLAKADQLGASSILNTWLLNLKEPQQKEITKVLSRSKEGTSLLNQSIEKKLLNHKVFDISSAERVYEVDTEDPIGITLFNEVKKKQKEDKKAFDAKLHRVMVIAKKEEGNAQNGEKLFQTCLLCHSVGSKGQDIAPALDGSALRENEALLTAILDPDAAVESSYLVYQVVKKNGDILEGYLVKKDNRSTTLGFMGGSKVFVQSNEIKTQGFQGGRSFMPKGLIEQYSNQQIADLLSYIRTLK